MPPSGAGCATCCGSDPEIVFVGEAEEADVVLDDAAPRVR